MDGQKTTWLKSIVFVQIFFLLIASVGVSQSFADFEFLPNNRHHQFKTYGLFSEEHGSLLYRNGGRAWGDLGVSLAFIEMSDWWGRPQLILFGTASSNFRLGNDGAGFLTETTDGRFGTWIEWVIDAQLRVSLGWLHYSGHVSDDVPDRSLMGLNLGNQFLAVKLIYDGLPNMRVGGTLKPILSSDPAMKALAMEQFLEWFPFGINEPIKRGKPYLALGFEQGGTTQWHWTSHLQLGLAFGSHFLEQHTAGARIVVGYYNGWDPSLKYAQFKNLRATFGYFGFMLDF